MCRGQFDSRPNFNWTEIFHRANIGGDSDTDSSNGSYLMSDATAICKIRDVFKSIFMCM